MWWGVPCPDQVTLAASVTGITVHQVGLFCPDGNEHKSKTASFQGNTIFQARTFNGDSQVTEHNHQFVKYNTEGLIKGLTAT